MYIDNKLVYFNVEEFCDEMVDYWSKDFVQETWVSLPQSLVEEYKVVGSKDL